MIEACDHQVAVEVFRKVSFERATMAMILRRLVGSKERLHRYFQSKGAVSQAAMWAADNLQHTLQGLAKDCIDVTLRDEVLAITRAALTEGGNLALGAHLIV